MPAMLMDNFSFVWYVGMVVVWQFSLNVCPGLLPPYLHLFWVLYVTFES